MICQNILIVLAHLLIFGGRTCDSASLIHPVIHKTAMIHVSEKEDNSLHENQAGYLSQNDGPGQPTWRPPNPATRQYISYEPTRPEDEATVDLPLFTLTKKRLNLPHQTARVRNPTPAPRVRGVQRPIVPQILMDLEEHNQPHSQPQTNSPPSTLGYNRALPNFSNVRSNPIIVMNERTSNSSHSRPHPKSARTERRRPVIKMNPHPTSPQNILRVNRPQLTNTYLPVTALVQSQVGSPNSSMDETIPNHSVNMEKVLHTVVNDSMQDMVNKLTNSLQNFLIKPTNKPMITPIATGEAQPQRSPVNSPDHDTNLKFGNSDTLSVDKRVEQNSTHEERDKNFWDFLVHSLLGPSYIKSNTTTTPAPVTQFDRVTPETITGISYATIPIISSLITPYVTTYPSHLRPTTMASNPPSPRRTHSPNIRRTPANLPSIVRIPTQTVLPFKYTPVSKYPIHSLPSSPIKNTPKLPYNSPKPLPDSFSIPADNLLPKPPRVSKNNFTSERTENTKNSSNFVADYLANVTREEARILADMIDASGIIEAKSSTPSTTMSTVATTTTISPNSIPPTTLDPFLSREDVVAHGFVEEKGHSTLNHPYEYEFATQIPNRFIVTGSPENIGGESNLQASAAVDNGNSKPGVSIRHPGLLLQTLLVSGSAAFAIIMFGVFGLLIACYRRPENVWCGARRLGRKNMPQMDPISVPIQYHPRSTPSLAGPSLDPRGPIITPYYYEASRSQLSLLNERERQQNVGLPRFSQQGGRYPEHSPPHSGTGSSIVTGTDSSPPISDRSSATFRNAAYSHNSILY